MHGMIYLNQIITRLNGIYLNKKLWKEALPETFTCQLQLTVLNVMDQNGVNITDEFVASASAKKRNPKRKRKRKRWQYVVM